MFLNFDKYSRNYGQSTVAVSLIYLLTGSLVAIYNQFIIRKAFIAPGAQVSAFIRYLSSVVLSSLLSRAPFLSIDSPATPAPEAPLPLRLASFHSHCVPPLSACLPRHQPKPHAGSKGRIGSRIWDPCVPEKDSFSHSKISNTDDDNIKHLVDSHGHVHDSNLLETNREGIHCASDNCSYNYDYDYDGKRKAYKDTDHTIATTTTTVTTTIMTSFTAATNNSNIFSSNNKMNCLSTYKKPIPSILDRKEGQLCNVMGGIEVIAYALQCFGLAKCGAFAIIITHGALGQLFTAFIRRWIFRQRLTSRQAMAITLVVCGLGVKAFSTLPFWIPLPPRPPPPLSFPPPSTFTLVHSSQLPAPPSSLVFLPALLFPSARGSALAAQGVHLDPTILPPQPSRRLLNEPICEGVSKGNLVMDPGVKGGGIIRVLSFGGLLLSSALYSLMGVLYERLQIRVRKRTGNNLPFGEVFRRSSYIGMICTTLYQLLVTLPYRRDLIEVPFRQSGWTLLPVLATLAGLGVLFFCNQLAQGRVLARGGGSQHLSIVNALRTATLPLASAAAACWFSAPSSTLNPTTHNDMDNQSGHLTRSFDISDRNRLSNISYTSINGGCHDNGGNYNIGGSYSSGGYHNFISHACGIGAGDFLSAALVILGAVKWSLASGRRQ